MAPAVAAARMRRIPYVLHEKDVRPGLATRYFAVNAAAICTTLPGTDKRLPNGRVFQTGVPLREGFEPRTPEVPPRRLLITGGSQGARRLNQVVWSALDGLCERFEEVVHVAGEQGAEGLARHARDRYRGIAFTDEMAVLMARADGIPQLFVVDANGNLAATEARGQLESLLPQLLAQRDAKQRKGGVGTIAEATAVGLPMVLVPGKFGGGHQEENAEAMVAAGTAIRISDDAITGDSLLRALDGLDGERLRAMARASAAAGRRDAAQRVVAVLHEVAENQMDKS